jgi:hypothetical protein
MIRKATINDSSQLQKMFTQAYQTTYHELLPHTMIQEDIIIKKELLKILSQLYRRGQVIW